MQHDEEMIAEAIQGDRLVLQQLLKAEKEKLYRMAYTYVKDEEEALEIFQQTVLQAIESVHQVKEPAYFSTWLTRICINKALAVLKKNKKLIVMEEVEERRVESDSVDIAQQLDVADALGLLPEKYKTALMLRFYQDFTVKQIAEVMNCPEGTVKTVIHRGLALLKKDLKGVYADERQRDFN
ncbi:sigma-70 family RNA polymerase sigma factor [Planococcus shenhongbingii]|uniref:Sigma-70 family RNA polymerase sigma factor n=1 Tax=Planococcus shenhongbingii TaxID=3058398 RepID=A0ABT8N7P0_9BACL|nr:sigma-70 family RNA polymerase sigma factor [Planococcus sp. N017]MDN7243899.1 sigma-70 family RNA polymerase sigma factor [Planococcus sp. N017]